MIRILIILAAILFIAISVAPAVQAAPEDPPPSCPPHESYSFPANPFYFFPPAGEYVCWVIIHDAAGRFDFPLDGCFFERCVSGMHSRALLKVSGPVQFKAVTVFTQHKIFLPITSR